MGDVAPWQKRQKGHRDGWVTAIVDKPSPWLSRDGSKRVIETRARYLGAAWIGGRKRPNGAKRA